MSGDDDVLEAGELLSAVAAGLLANLVWLTWSFLFVASVGVGGLADLLAG